MIISPPYAHPSGAVSLNCESGCWRVNTGCEAEPTDLSSPIVVWFLLSYKDLFNTHLIWVLLPMTCCMLRDCPRCVYCVLPALCPLCARLTERRLDLTHGGQAVELVVIGDWAYLHSLILLPLEVSVAEFRCVLWKCPRLGGSATLLSFLTGVVLNPVVAVRGH